MGKFAKIGVALSGKHFNSEKKSAYAGLDFLYDICNKLRIPENLKEKLQPAEAGLFKLVNADSETRFILTTEISCVYTKKDRTRKIHILIFAPSFEVVEKINVQLGWIGNIKATAVRFWD
jgi:PHP family Zn ribbon phosphoesterase